MEKMYINLDEAFDVLTNNVDMLSGSLQQELSYMCDLRTDDDYYIFADLIRNKRSKELWGLFKYSNDQIIMLLNQPNKELKPSVYNLLQKIDFIKVDKLDSLVTIQ